MNIVQITPFFDPATIFGGPVASLRALCPRLAKRGHTVYVVTTDVGVGDDVTRNAWVEHCGCRVWYAEAGRLGRRPPYRVPGAARALADVAPTASVLHVQSALNMLNEYARHAAQQHGVPLVYTPRGSLCPVRMRHKAITKMLFLHAIERRVLRHVTIAQALTAHEADDLVRNGLPRSRIRIIPNGVELDNGSRVHAGLQFRASHGIRSEQAVILFLSRIHRCKGLDLLVKAFQKRVAAGSDAVLVIAGPDDGYRRIIEQLIVELNLQSRVIFTGHLDGEHRDAAFQAADIFALTSYSEGLPNVAIEAAAMECPLLITEQCNLPQAASHQAGRVCQTHVADIDQALAELLDNQELRLGMGKRARKMVRERFLIDHVVTEVESMYESATKLLNQPALDTTMHTVGS